MQKLIDTLLLMALPASGKSEIRRYLAELSGARLSYDKTAAIFSKPGS